MCGIVGYISKNDNPNALRLGIEALKRLEYRGYDSAGFAFLNKNQNEIFCQKSVGRITNLEAKTNDINSFLANPIILHTRWATHGGVTEENAHPHFDCHKNIYVVHNGIIENYKELKEELIKEGHKFSSETDTEVICHLIEKFFKGNLEEAVRKALTFLRGTYGIAVISRQDPEKIIAARFGSPLLLGLGENEYLIASDPAAVIAHTKKVIYLDDGEIVTITPDNFFILKEKKPEDIEWSLEDAQKGGYPHFMLKEIMEQPESLESSLRGRLIIETGQAKLGGLEQVKEKLKRH